MQLKGVKSQSSVKKIILKGHCPGSGDPRVQAGRMPPLLISDVVSGLAPRIGTCTVLTAVTCWVTVLRKYITCGKGKPLWGLQDHCDGRTRPGVFE